VSYGTQTVRLDPWRADGHGVPTRNRHRWYGLSQWGGLRAVQAGRTNLRRFHRGLTGFVQVHTRRAGPATGSASGLADGCVPKRGGAAPLTVAAVGHRNQLNTDLALNKRVTASSSTQDVRARQKAVDGKHQGNYMWRPTIGRVGPSTMHVNRSRSDPSASNHDRPAAVDGHWKNHRTQNAFVLGAPPRHLLLPPCWLGDLHLRNPFPPATPPVPIRFPCRHQRDQYVELSYNGQQTSQNGEHRPPRFSALLPKD